MHRALSRGQALNHSRLSLDRSQSRRPSTRVPRLGPPLLHAEPSVVVAEGLAPADGEADALVGTAPCVRDGEPQPSKIRPARYHPTAGLTTWNPAPSVAPVIYFPHSKRKRGRTVTASQGVGKADGAASVSVHPSISLRDNALRCLRTTSMNGLRRATRPGGRSSSNQPSLTRL